MIYKDIGSWRFPDPAPGIRLDEILPFSIRASALMLRNYASPILKTHFINIAGAIEFMAGMDYHFERFQAIINVLAMSDQGNEQALRHEAIAYLNRVGQFLSFTNSSLVQSRISDLESMIPTMLKLKIFRDKHSAHRSLDAPRGEPESLQHNHAASLSMLGGSIFSPKPGLPADQFPDLAKVKTQSDLENHRRAMWRTMYFGFPIYDPDRSQLNFFLEEDHYKVSSEAFEVLKALIVERNQ